MGDPLKFFLILLAVVLGFGLGYSFRDGLDNCNESYPSTHYEFEIINGNTLADAVGVAKLDDQIFCFPDDSDLEYEDLDDLPDHMRPIIHEGKECWC